MKGIRSANFGKRGIVHFVTVFGWRAFQQRTLEIGAFPAHPNDRAALRELFVFKGYFGTRPGQQGFRDEEAQPQSRHFAAAHAPAALGRDVSFVILGVGYDEEVNEVVLGPQGILQSLAPGSIIAVSSTVAIDTVQTLDAKAQEKATARRETRCAKEGTCC